MKNPKNDNFPLVSVISVNYNQSAVTLEMLESFRKVTYPNYEIIIVDNGSPNDNPEIIRNNYPEVNLIKSAENLGFAGGNNLGIKASKGDYVLLINNDTEVDPNFLQPLVKKFQTDKIIGAVSPKIYFHHTPKMLQFTGFSKMNNYTIRNHGWGYGKMDNGQFDEDKETFFAHGAAMMVSREVMQKVGLMAEIFFLYYEEMDWAQRIRDAGYKIFYIHNSMIYHKESISTGKQSPLKIHYMNRARTIYTLRNNRGLSLWIALLYQFLFAFPKNALSYLIKGRFDLLKAHYHAMVWNLKKFRNKEIHHNPTLTQ
jgi:GT2 family glycosyltransferase